MSGHGKKWEQIGKKEPQNKSRSCEKAPGPNFLVTLDKKSGLLCWWIKPKLQLPVAVLYLAEPIEISNHAPKANQPTNPNKSRLNFLQLTTQVQTHHDTMPPRFPNWFRWLWHLIPPGDWTDSWWFLVPIVPGQKESHMIHSSSAKESVWMDLLQLLNYLIAVL